MIVPIQFRNRNSQNADAFETAGHHWNPDLHFTGMLQSVAEVRFVEALLEKYGRHIVAHHIYSPYVGTYSVELQFGASEADRKAMRACRNEYSSAFRESGKMKKNVAEQHVINTGDFRMIVVRPALPPEIVSIQRTKIESVVDDVVWGTWQSMPYPAQYNRPLTTIADDNGIGKGSPYNRWGIVGGFVVTRISKSGSHLTLSDKQIESVLDDLNDADGGYLSPESGMHNQFREPFAAHGVPPSGWAPPAGSWFN